MGRPPDAAAVRQRVATFIVAGAALLGGAAPLRAEDEIPPALRALETSDAGARDAATAALRAASDGDDLVVAWLRDASRRDRLGAPALQALADLAGERGLKLANSGLRALLRDTEKPLDVRRAAAVALAKTASIADVAAFGDGMADLPDECARGLVAIGGDAAIAVLRRADGEAPQPEVSAALAKLGDRSRLPSLVAMLAKDDTRERAATLLRWATGRDLPADAVAWTDYVRRDGIATGLAAEDADAAQALAVELADKVRGGDTKLADDLAAILADDTAALFARTKAALVLGLSGTRAKNDVLLAACSNGKPGDVRRYAARALARVGDLRIAIPFAAMLVHDEDRDRLAAKRTQNVEFVPVDPEFVRAMHRVGIRGGTLAMLDDLKGDYRTGLHRDCLSAIAEVSGGETFGLQPDGSKADRVAAIDRITMWWREARETVPVPPPAADDPGWSEFRKGVDAQIAQLAPLKFLTQFRAKKALMMVAEAAAPQLVAALSSDDLHIRIGTAEIMEGTALRQFVAPLVARLRTEPNGAVRVKLLTALEQCGRRASDGTVPGGKDTQEIVRTSLDAREVDVRIAAARVLGVVGDPADAERLRAARAEPRNDVEAFRCGSGGARLLLGDRGGVADLCAALRSGDVAIRADAVRYLRTARADLHGFDVDAAPQAREAAVAAIEADVSQSAHK